MVTDTITGCLFTVKINYKLTIYRNRSSEIEFNVAIASVVYIIENCTVFAHNNINVCGGIVQKLIFIIVNFHFQSVFSTCNNLEVV